LNLEVLSLKKDNEILEDVIEGLSWK
jgi:hypothetical protein